jgi:PAS domain S-box-containing protein
MKRSSNENLDSYKTSSYLARLYNRLRDKSRFMRPEIKLDAVLAAMTDAVVITDAKGVFIDFNEPFAKLNRFKTKLECAKALSEYTVNFTATTPDGVTLTAEQWPIMRALYGESGANLELIVTRSDTNERWIGLYNYAPIRADNSSIIGSVLTGRDITEFRETEEHLRNLSSRLHLALTSAHLGVWEWDIINDKLTWDDRMFELYGVAREDFTTNYSAWAHGVHPEDRDDAMERISQALQGERDFDTQFRVVHPNGTIRYLKAAGLVLCGTDGKPQRMLGVNADITEEKLAKDKLHAAYADIENKVVERTAQLEAAKVAAENANKAKDLFLATLSHELRSPLSAILSGTQLMERGMLSADKLQVGIRAIKESVWAQNQLIGDLLDLSRIHTGKLAIERQPTDVIEVLKAAIEMIRPTAEQHNLLIEESFDSPSIYISADPARLKQSFWNVLSNAVKFTLSGGKISTCVKCTETPEGPKVQIAIKDTGKGIKQDFIPHIFERFSQADPTSIRVHGGMGLGLPLVKSLTELQDGTVTAHSPGEGL